MNFLDKLVARIEESRKENKNPCKNYATKEAAEKATAKAAQNVANNFYAARFNNPDAVARPAEYIVLFIESWGRWVGFINLSEVVERKESTGGYLGVETGFYKY